VISPEAEIAVIYTAQYTIHVFDHSLTEIFLGYSLTFSMQKTSLILVEYKGLVMRVTRNERVGERQEENIGNTSIMVHEKYYLNSSKSPLQT
jgi:hypothetical protein